MLKGGSMSNRTISGRCKLAALIGLLISSTALTDDNLDAEFNPLLSRYDANKLSAGTQIDSSNIADYRNWLDDSVADLIWPQCINPNHWSLA